MPYFRSEKSSGSPTIGGDAKSQNVFYGKTFYSSESDQMQTGTMPVTAGTATIRLNCDESYTVANGYHYGREVVANSLASQTGVGAGFSPIDSAHVLDGYEGWVNGNLVIGSYVPPDMLYAGEGRAETTARVFEPDTGYDGFFEFTVLPQVHDNEFQPTANAYNDMGAIHNYRYVDTRGMIKEEVTNLWENIDPESEFASQGVYMTFTSTQIANAKLRISYADIITRTREYNTITIPLDYLVQDTVPSSITVYNASRYFARPFIYDSANQELTFFDCQRIGGSLTNNNIAIPLSIDLIG